MVEAESEAGREGPGGRCVVHAGMHKTGTSSIQQSFDGFEDDRFVYANAGRHPNHSQVLFKILEFELPDRRGRKPQAAGTSRPDSAAAFRRSMASAGRRTFLISGEGISLLPKAKLARLRQFLEEAFDEIAIVAAVRPPASYMASVFQGPVRHSMRNYVDIRYRGYERTFSKFDEVFGRENVRLWKFDPRSYPGGCAVRDFCARVGVDLPPERIVRVNESLSREALGLLFAYRTFADSMGATDMTSVQHAELLAQLLKIGRTRFRFSPEVVRPILDRNRHDIEWMEARLGDSLQEPLDDSRPGDVRDAADLLKPDPQAVRELVALLGSAAPRGVKGETAEEVARLVHALRKQSSLHESSPKERKSGKGLFPLGSRRGPVADKPTSLNLRNDLNNGGSEMKVTELIGEIRKTHPKALEGVDDKSAAELIRHVFRQINEKLAGTGNGVVKYAGLGRFRVKTVAKEVEGKKVNRLQIVFRAAPGEGKEEEDGE